MRLGPATGRARPAPAPANQGELAHLLPLLLLLAAAGRAAASCDETFVSSAAAQQPARRFQAPVRGPTKPFRVSLDGQGRASLAPEPNGSRAAHARPIHCLYKFVAGPGERVALNFTSFQLLGDEPDCAREYVDVHIKFKHQDDLQSLVAREPPSGRFCTSIQPRRLVSLHNLILLVVHSDLERPAAAKPMFAGSYEFLRADRLFEHIGPPEPSTLCSHSVRSAGKREGEFYSLTYPGVYPKGLRCSYRFLGEPGQRVRLEFLDLDLFSGGSHCPLDSVKVFDGLEESDPIISTICGSHRSLIVFSTRHSLLVTFTTLEREADVQNRGFSGYFEFSDKFVDPDFIQGPHARHIRGSECDQRIVSQKRSSGSIISPEPKHHQNAICRYIFEGLQNSLDYEKVLLKFTDFDLRTSRALAAAAAASTSTTSTSTSTSTTTTTTSTTTTTTTTTPAPQSFLFNLLPLNQSAGQDASSTSAANSSAEQCADNYVRLYTGEQKSDQKQDPNDYDYVFCSSDVPASIESDAASLLMEYNSGSIGGYFRADYNFIVDFRIPGIQPTSGCNYVYKSDQLKSGTFNSPRHPSWYISDMTCTYTFLTRHDEALLLQFNTFKMANSFNEKILGYNEACKSEDKVEIFELTLDSNEQRILDQYEIGTYCGTTTPGPILSFKSIRINFKTNKEEVHYGFSAGYNFFPLSIIKTNEFVTNCGGQIFASQRVRTGILASPETYRPETYEKRHHICSWNITARSNYKIALDFNKFELEGSPTVRGCITASVRIQLGKSKMPLEICGTLNPANNTVHQFVSDNEWLCLTFISTKQASGSNGFIATWSEIKRLN